MATKHSGTTGPAEAEPARLGLARAILGGTLLVGGIQASIKVLGFGEKVILGNIYGTDSPTYAAYLVAFEVLLVFSEVLKLSVIPVLVPALERVRRAGSDLEARRLAGRFGTVVVLAAAGGVALPALVLAGPILRATFAREWLADPARRDYVVLMTAFFRVIVGGMVFTAAGVVTYGLINSYRRFGPAALGDLAFKLLALGGFLLVGFVLGPRRYAVFGLAGGVLAGCIGYVGVHLVFLGRTGCLAGVRPALDLRDADLRRTLALFLPLLASMLVFNGRRIFDKLLASRMELADYVAAQDFAFRFVETPYRFLIEPFAIVLLPYLSALAVRGDRDALRRNTLSALRALLVVFAPVSVGFYLLRRPIIQVLLEHGRFDAASTYLTCTALRWYVAALTLWGLDLVIQRVYFAAGETSRPTLFELAAMGLYLWLAVHWRGSLRHEGLALAFALSRVLKVGLLAAFLRGKLGGLEGRCTAWFLCRLLVACGVMGGAVFALARAMERPQGVLIRADAEGERFTCTDTDNSQVNGRRLARLQGLPDRVRLAPGGTGEASLLLVIPRAGRYRLWVRARSAQTQTQAQAKVGAGAQAEMEAQTRAHAEAPGGRGGSALEVRLAGRRFLVPALPRMQWLPAGDLYLPRGLDRLVVAARGGEVELDALVLDLPAGAAEAFTPTGGAPPRAGRRGVVTRGPAGLRGRRLALIVAASLVGFALYVAMLRILRVEELGDALRIVRLRRK